MAKNGINQRSDKGVPSGRVITSQPKSGSANSACGCGPKYPACNSKVNSVEMAPTLTYEQIAERARLIWQTRGCKPGEDERNWSEAQAQLKAELGID